MASNDFSIGKLVASVFMLTLGALGLAMTLCGLVFAIPGMSLGVLVIVPLLSVALGVGLLVLVVRFFGRSDPNDHGPDRLPPPTSGRP